MSKNNIPDMLLAKSKRGDIVVSLQRHLLETEQTSKEIFCLDKRWGRSWCRFFKLSTKNQQEKFLLNLRVAALFHDMGKANEEFYLAVSSPNRFAQTLRHEHISALLLHLPAIKQWISANPMLDFDVICAAVLSHHIKAARDGDKWRWCQPKHSKILRLYLQHPEVKFILEEIAKVANLSTPVPNLPTNSWSEQAPWQQAYLQGITSANKLKFSIAKDLDRCSLLLAVKAGLIVADSASSGLVRENHKITDWINDVVHTKSIAETDIDNAILTPRILQIEKNKNKPFKYQSFQEKAATLGPRALLLAACGAGKTLAAWKWAEAQTKDSQQEIGKVIFLYPTKGTATEGFRDYVSWAPETEASLVHSSSRYELEAIMKNPNEEELNKNLKDFRLSEAEQRLFALGLWSRRYFSATVDQFLSFIEHGYTSLCLLPVLADAAVIIDEVHSFDRRMFDNLVNFLKRFDVPVLCMTATLSPARQKELLDIGLRLYPNEGERLEFTDLADKEQHPRYNHETLANQEKALEKAVSAYKTGKRVLWVVNTIARCQQIAKQLEDKLKQEVLIYHSRYKLKDRQTIHASTVKAFQQQKDPVIAVTTQVCEMSLDLDADVLITEIAPVSSLVQRFGRANRHLARGQDFRAQLYSYLPESHLPYSKEEIQTALKFIQSLGSTNISQALMATKLEEFSLIEPKADETARFLSGGYFATPGNLRDIDDFTFTSILNDDLDELDRKLKEKRPYDELLISVPKKYADKDGKSNSRPDWLPKYLAIAPSNHYCPRFGFMEKEEK